MTNSRFQTYQKRLSRPISERIADFAHGQPSNPLDSNHATGDLKHLILSEQLSMNLLTQLFTTTRIIRALQVTKRSSDALRSVLSHRRAMLFFSQPSTRTYLSFVSACQLLGMPYTEIRDPRMSSEAKGEDIFDSLRMFAANNHIIIMRSELQNLAECAAYLMNDLETAETLPIVNGGSGADEHPTQALLDMYTIYEAFKTKESPESLEDAFAEKTYVFVGDIGRGRTVRSLSVLLGRFSKVRLIFVAPNHPTLKLPASIRQRLEARGAAVEESDDLQAVLPQADMVYMTRIQNEHDDANVKSFYKTHDLTKYHLNAASLSLLKRDAVLLHPFPRNQEIHFSVDHDIRARYFSQAENGMWTRAALLAHLFGVEDKIAALHQTLSPDLPC